MRAARSRLGWLLVAVYVVTFVVAYFDAEAKRGTFLSDIWLDILALPYIAIVGRLPREVTRRGGVRSRAASA